jgi:hypothetical protein
VKPPNGPKLTGLEPQREIVPHSGRSKLRLQVRCSAELGGFSRNVAVAGGVLLEERAEFTYGV